jgi:hypothetical protein
MRLRNLLAATTAIVAAGAATVVPAAQASNPTGGIIASIAVGGSTANSSHAIDLTMKSATVTFNFSGTPATLGCSGGSASGTISGGASGPSPVAGGLIYGISLSCAGFFIGPGSCSLEMSYSDSNVHTGLVDVGVPGTSKLSAVDGSIAMSNSSGTDCAQGGISIGGLPCTFSIGGSSSLRFDETVKTVSGQNRQDLHLSTTALRIHAPTGCFGVVSNNQAITLNAVFNVHSPDGLIDFGLTPAPTDPPKVLVDGSDAASDYDLDGPLASASATLAVYGIPLTLACTSGTAGGAVHGGAPDTDPALTFDQVSLTCPSIFPGTTASMTLDQCDIEVVMDDANVHEGLDPLTDDVDTGTGVLANAVDGLAHLSARTDPSKHCLRVNISNGCQFRIGGTTTVKFHEATDLIGGTDYQTLELTGAGLQIKNPTSCAGAVVNNAPITVATSLKVHSPDGLIDFVPAP